ncbi:unnamed protein product [Polarella glacialis]|uniref:H(+)-exporting diphosphatase n=1 Tax=Polarella glacialis TaxID=89957 RepID=A0A813GIU8_POLGL|nr:unnamed protein product [Polarella glacialis]
MASLGVALLLLALVFVVSAHSPVIRGGAAVSGSVLLHPLLGASPTGASSSLSFPGATEAAGSTLRSPSAKKSLLLETHRTSEAEAANASLHHVEEPQQESAFGSFLKQMGAACLISLLCIGLLAAKRDVSEKQQFLELVKAAGMGQGAVLLAAFLVFLLSAVVNIPGYAMVFLMGTAWNVCAN